MTPFVDFYKPELSIIASSILPSKWSHLPSKIKFHYLANFLASKQFMIPLEHQLWYSECLLGGCELVRNCTTTKYTNLQEAMVTLED